MFPDDGMTNLPDYFMADLPPEAVLTPTMITAACQTLKRNRSRYLLPRATDSLVKLLSEVAADWLRPEGRFRRLALERGPEETGFSQTILERGLAGFFRQLTAENIRSLLKQELGDAHRLDGLAGDLTESGWGTNRSAMAVGPEFLMHIAAGNLPNPTLMSMTLGLLVRSAQLVKCARGTSFLPRLFAHSLYEADAKVGACLEIVEWEGGNHALEQAAWAEADCLTVTGSDETLAEVRSRLPAGLRMLGYGHRVSFGYITREALREEEIDNLVARAAEDIIAWDQHGCLSPHVIYVEERGQVESDKFTELLVRELGMRESALPRRKISVAAAAAIASRRALYETLAVHRADAKIWSSQGSTAWTVVFEHDPRFQFSCLNRFIFVKPVPDLAAVLQGIDAIQGKVSTLGLAAGPERAKELALIFGRWGVTRICPLGQMQNPPLSWRHDGRPPLGDLITWTDFES
jgi:hypothetical protein